VGKGHFGETRMRSTQCALQAANNMTRNVDKSVFLEEGYLKTDSLRTTLSNHSATDMNVQHQQIKTNDTTVARWH
jgi:hypothetical protein